MTVRVEVAGAPAPSLAETLNTSGMFAPSGIALIAAAFGTKVHAPVLVLSVSVP